MKRYGIVRNKDGQKEHYGGGAVHLWYDSFTEASGVSLALSIQYMKLGKSWTLQVFEEKDMSMIKKNWTKRCVKNKTIVQFYPEEFVKDFIKKHVILIPNIESEFVKEYDSNDVLIGYTSKRDC